MPGTTELPDTLKRSIWRPEASVAFVASVAADKFDAGLRAAPTDRVWRLTDCRDARARRQYNRRAM